MSSSLDRSKSVNQRAAEQGLTRSKSQVNFLEGEEPDASGDTRSVFSSRATRRDSVKSQTSNDSLPPQGPHSTTFTEEDIYTAWKMLCPQGLEQTVMSKSQVLESLRAFFPYMTAREVKELVGPGNLSIEKLRSLLFHPDVPTFDSNVEAFKIVDPHATGYMDGQSLARLVVQLPGIGYIDEDDLKVIMAVADPDQDGRISLKDFSTIGSWVPEELDQNSANCLLPSRKQSSTGKSSS